MAARARIVYVGHATVLVDLDGVRLLTDPVLRRRFAHLRRVGDVDTEALRDLDAVLISHGHFDHLDLPSLELLGRAVPLVVPRGAGRLLERRGFGSITELAVGEEHRVGSLAVRATAAVHDSRRRPFGMRADPLGYLVEGSRSVYFAGDTELFDDMASLGPVEVALVPISGWGPRLGAGHMDARAAAEAVRLLQASIAVPIHWGTYFPLRANLRGLPPLIEGPAEEFRSRVSDVAPGADVRILRPGEATDV
jgi:L-ascorbate metabolism protein UlaG (beta-lactamase superfamily)